MTHSTLIYRIESLKENSTNRSRRFWVRYISYVPILMEFFVASTLVTSSKKTIVQVSEPISQKIPLGRAREGEIPLGWALSQVSISYVHKHSEIRYAHTVNNMTKQNIRP